MFKSEMIPIINRAIQTSLKDLSTYHGYNGGEVLKLVFTDSGIAIDIRNYAKTLGFDTNILKDKDNYEVYCVYEYTTDIYTLKD